MVYNYSQPIIDNVHEAVAGINADLAVKIFGNDLVKLDKLADSTYNILANRAGNKGSRHHAQSGPTRIEYCSGRTKNGNLWGYHSDANSVIEMAIGGKSASTFYQQERKFDIRIRYPEQYRNNEGAIGDLRVPTIHGSKIPLKEIAEIKTITGPAFIYRDKNTRFIAIKFSIRERDMGSTIAEAQEKVDDQISLGKGFSYGMGG